MRSSGQGCWPKAGAATTSDVETMADATAARSRPRAAPVTMDDGVPGLTTGGTKESQTNHTEDDLPGLDAEDRGVGSNQGDGSGRRQSESGVSHGCTETFARVRTGDHEPSRPERR